MASTRYPQRVRNDLRFRELTVLRVERVSAGFQRIVLGGEALEGFRRPYQSLFPGTRDNVYAAGGHR